MRTSASSGPGSDRRLGSAAFLLLAAAGLGLWGGWGPSLLRIPQPPLRVGIHDRIAHSPLAYAEAAGFLDPRRLRLSELGSSTALSLGLRNDTFDAAAVTLDEALEIAANGSDIVVVLVMAESRRSDGLVANASVPDAASLRGRRIGVETATSAAHVLAGVLARAGIPAGEATVVDLSPDRHEVAFAAGEVDAVVTFEPILSALAARGGRVLDDAGTMAGQIVDVLVVQQPVAATRKADLDALLDAWFRATSLLAADRTSCLPLLARATGRRESELDRALESVRFPDRPEQAALLSGPSPALRATAGLVEASLRPAGQNGSGDAAARLLPEGGALAGGDGQ